MNRKITIIGWYGTETIGDRAILAGLLGIFAEVFDVFSIQLGSLYPHFSKRVMIEDIEFHKKISNGKMLGLSIFNSLDRRELNVAIDSSDIVIVGGGPLMDIEEMHMLHYTFKRSKKRHIPTFILGCGWGPLKNTKIIECAKRMIELSDLTIFRDQDSIDKARENGIRKNLIYSIDPAFFCADYYRAIYNDSKRSEEFIVANFRDVISSESTGFHPITLSRLESIVSEIIESTNKSLILVPQHSFWVGGDDRDLFNKLAFKINNPMLKVINNPTSLEQTMDYYYNALACIGMRFHSIALQLVLSGRNFILDYTDPNRGKIKSMLRQLNLFDENEERYISLHSSPKNIDWKPFLSSPRQMLDHSLIQGYRDIYVSNLKKITIDL